MLGTSWLVIVRSCSFIFSFNYSFGYLLIRENWKDLPAPLQLEAPDVHCWQLCVPLPAPLEAVCSPWSFCSCMQILGELRGPSHLQAVRAAACEQPTV